MYESTLRSRRARRVALAAALIAGLAATTATSQREELGSEVIVWPDERFASIQDAIDALRDGGTLRLPGGVVTLDAPLSVRGNRIVIEGRGCDELPRNPRKPQQGGATHLVGPGVTAVADFASVRAAITFESGGTIRDLKLSGFDAGIGRVAGDDTAPAAGVVVENVCITDTGRGIAWADGPSLSVKNVLIRDVAWNGVSIAAAQTLAGTFIHFMGVTVVNAANACIFVQNTQAAIVGGLFNFCGSSGTIVGLNANLFIAQTNIAGSHGPGIALSGGSAFIHETVVNQATGFGLLLHNVVHGDIEEVHVKNTHTFTAGPQAGLFGDGVTVVGGTANGLVWVTDSFIENAPHSGVANYGAFVSVGDLKIQCATFDLEGEVLGTTNFSFTDLGGNKCGCPAPSGTCVAQTGGSPQAPGPVVTIP